MLNPNERLWIERFLDEIRKERAIKKNSFFYFPQHFPQKMQSPNEWFLVESIQTSDSTRNHKPFCFLFSPNPSILTKPSRTQIDQSDQNPQTKTHLLVVEHETPLDLVHPCVDGGVTHGGAGTKAAESKRRSGSGGGWRRIEEVRSGGRSPTGAESSTCTAGGGDGF